MAIYVVRHGETEQGAARVVQVPATRLSPAGRMQAERLAARVSALGVSRILSSDLARAVETAAIVSARIAVPVEQDPVLRERDFGALRGVAYTDLTCDPFAADYVPPEGESWAVFHERVAAAWTRITEAAAETSGNLLVVTHGLVCGALAKNHWHVAHLEPAPALWANSALAEIEAMPPWKALRLNCAAHLMETGQ